MIIFMVGDIDLTE